MKFAKTQAQKIVAAFASGLPAAAAPALTRAIEAALATVRKTSEARGYKKGDRDAWLGALVHTELVENDLKFRQAGSVELRMIRQLRELFGKFAHEHEKRATKGAADAS